MVTVLSSVSISLHVIHNNGETNGPLRENGGSAVTAARRPPHRARHTRRRRRALRLAVVLAPRPVPKHRIEREHLLRRATSRVSALEQVKVEDTKKATRYFATSSHIGCSFPGECSAGNMGGSSRTWRKINPQTTQN